MAADHTQEMVANTKIVSLSYISHFVRNVEVAVSGRESSSEVGLGCSAIQGNLSCFQVQLA